MLEILISSKTRLKLLLRLFLNPESQCYLRGLAEEFNESTNSIRVELNRFERAGMLNSHSEGNRKIFQANRNHNLFHDIRRIILKHVGIDVIVEKIVKRLGSLEMVYLSGDFAMGKDSEIIDIILVGDDVNRSYLLQLIEKVEKSIDKRVRYLIYNTEEFDVDDLNKQQYLLIWNA